MKAKVRIDMRILALATLVLTATLILGGAMLTMAATDSKNLAVTVSIAATTEITLTPTSLAWTDSPLGAADTAKYVDVKNTGSQNLISLYAYGDTLTDEATRPYGTGSASNYAAGGVLKIANQSASTYYWMGRLEWNWTDDISNMVKTGVNSPVAWGFYKNASMEFNWLIGNGTDGRCNETGSQFAIEADADIGTPGTRTPAQLASRIGGDQYWGYFNISVDPLNGYCIAVNQTCDKAFVYKFDKRTTGATNFATCNVASDLTVPQNPSDVSRLMIQPYIPKGLPAGTMSDGATITFVATS